VRTFIFAGLCLLIVSCISYDAGAQGIGTLRDYIDVGRVVLPLPHPPGTPDDLRFVVTQPSRVETQLELQWSKVPHATGYRVFRKLEPVVFANGAIAAPSPLIGESAIFPYAWHEIAQINDDGSSQVHFIDTDIPPPDLTTSAAERRRLGAPYCYKVEAYNNAGMTESNTTCKRLRGINAPTNVTGEATSPTSIKISWRGQSAFEWGYKLYYRRAYETGYNVFWYNAAGSDSYEINFLSPETEYCITVTAFDYYGESERQNDICNINTPPEPGSPPEEHNFTVQLLRQIVYEGPVPYVGSFPTGGGLLPAGNLIQVRSTHWNPTLYFVKPGKSTADCNDPDAVIPLNTNSALSSSDMEMLYGSATPRLPIVFLACAAATTPLLDAIPINITYIKDE